MINKIKYRSTHMSKISGNASCFENNGNYPIIVCFGKSKNIKSVTEAIRGHKLLQFIMAEGHNNV